MESEKGERNFRGEGCSVGIRTRVGRMERWRGNFGGVGKWRLKMGDNECERIG